MGARRGNMQIQSCYRRFVSICRSLRSHVGLRRFCSSSSSVDLRSAAGGVRRGASGSSASMQASRRQNSGHRSGTFLSVNGTSMVSGRPREKTSLIASWPLGSRKVNSWIWVILMLATRSLRMGRDNWTALPLASTRVSSDGGPNDLFRKSNTPPPAGPAAPAGSAGGRECPSDGWKGGENGSGVFLDIRERKRLHNPCRPRKPFSPPLARIQYDKSKDDACRSLEVVAMSLADVLSEVQSLSRLDKIRLIQVHAQELE